MRPALLLAAKDLRQRLRDRSLFIFGALVPFALTFIFDLLLGPVSGDAPFTARLALVDEDGSVVSAGLRSALDAAADAGVVTWEAFPDVAAARAGLAEGRASAVMVVPAGFGAAVLGGSPAALTVVGDPDRGLAAQVAEGVAAAYVSRLRAATLASAALAGAGVASLPALTFAQVAAAPDPFRLVAAPTSPRQLDLTTYYAAGMAVFFVFFIVQLGVTGLLDEERDGTLPRLLAAPVPRRAVLFGKVLSSVVIGVLSMAVLAAASTVVMGADWGQPLGAALLVLAVVAAAAGVLMLVAGLARSPEAAGNVQAIVAITLGSVGGVFFRLPTQEGLLSYLQALSPHHWFMQGMADLAGGGVASIGDELLALAVFAVVAGGVGWIALERRLNR
ncbi:MAG TPA: ABC transporter permease [Trueperaceae bacterium]|nr:ABC transporter permease [Trueperaceae bacterium]